MKKLVILLFLASLGSPAFADDAMVLPTGTFRISVVPSSAQ
jgi:hypothetical protein